MALLSVAGWLVLAIAFGRNYHIVNAWSIGAGFVARNRRCERATSNSRGALTAVSKVWPTRDTGWCSATSSPPSAVLCRSKIQVKLGSSRDHQNPTSLENKINMETKSLDDGVVRDQTAERGGDVPNQAKRKRGKDQEKSNNTKPYRKGGKNLPTRRLSHHLSWALRHAAPELGLTMTPDGFVPVQEILACDHKKFRGVTLEAIQHVVSTNDKQRFALAERPAKAYGKGKSADDDETILCIRANQGHSVSTIDPDLLLTKLSSDEILALPMIVHGTYRDPYENHIRHDGLKIMNRTHIHCATGLATGQDKVVSGIRRSCQIYVYINPQRCVEDGIPFYQSANGVILTAGVGGAGCLPPKYFSLVTSSEGDILLDQRNK